MKRTSRREGLKESPPYLRCSVTSFNNSADNNNDNAF